MLGDDHSWTLENTANLANTHRDQGYLDDVVALWEAMMEKKKQLLSDGHPDTLKSMSSLAATYRDLGHLDGARALESIVEEHKKRCDGS